MLEVRGNTLLLGGADIVDGSPVLDIKPYVPFCDGVTSAAAPAWVTVSPNTLPTHRQFVMWWSPSIWQDKTPSFMPPIAHPLHPAPPPSPFPYPG